MFLDLAELTIAFFQYLYLILSAPQVTYTKAWDDTGYAFSVLALGKDILGSQLDFFVSDHKVFFTIIAVVVPLVLIFLGLIALNPKRNVLWFFALLMGLLFLMAGIASLVMENYDAFAGRSITRNEATNMTIVGCIVVMVCSIAFVVSWVTKCCDDHALLQMEIEEAAAAEEEAERQRLLKLNPLASPRIASAANNNNNSNDNNNDGYSPVNKANEDGGDKSPATSPTAAATNNGGAVVVVDEAAAKAATTEDKTENENQPQEDDTNKNNNENEKSPRPTSTNNNKKSEVSRSRFSIFGLSFGGNTTLRNSTTAGSAATLLMSREATMKKETQEINWTDQMEGFCVFVILFLLGLIFVEAIPPSTVGLDTIGLGSASVLKVMFPIGVVFLIFSVASVAWSALSWFEKGRIWRWKAVAVIETNAMWALLILMSLLYMPITSAVFVMFNCNPLTCDQGSRILDEGSLIVPYSTDPFEGCLACEVQTEVPYTAIPADAPPNSLFDDPNVFKQQCPADLASRVCGGSTSSRLEASVDIPCSRMANYFFPAAGILIVSFILGLPILFFRIIQQSSSLVRQVVPAAPGAANEEERWESQLIATENVAKFLYQPTAYRYRFLRLYEIARRFITTIVSSYIFRTTFSSGYIAIFVSLGVHFLTFVLFITVRPHINGHENRTVIACTASLVVFLIFAAISVTNSDALPEGLLIAILVLVIIVPAVFFLYGLYLWWAQRQHLKETQEELDEKQIRHLITTVEEEARAVEREELDFIAAEEDRLRARAEEKKNRKLFELEQKERLLRGEPLLLSPNSPQQQQQQRANGVFAAVGKNNNKNGGNGSAGGEDQQHVGIGIPINGEGFEVVAESNHHQQQQEEHGFLSSRAAGTSNQLVRINTELDPLNLAAAKAAKSSNSSNTTNNAANNNNGKRKATPNASSTDERATTASRTNKRRGTVVKIEIEDLIGSSDEEEEGLLADAAATYADLQLGGGEDDDDNNVGGGGGGGTFNGRRSISLNNTLTGTHNALQQLGRLPRSRGASVSLGGTLSGTASPRNITTANGILKITAAAPPSSLSATARTAGGGEAGGGEGGGLMLGGGGGDDNDNDNDEASLKNNVNNNVTDTFFNNAVPSASDDEINKNTAAEPDPTNPNEGGHNNNNNDETDNQQQPQQQNASSSSDERGGGGGGRDNGIKGKYNNAPLTGTAITRMLLQLTTRFSPNRKKAKPHFLEKQEEIELRNQQNNNIPSAPFINLMMARPGAAPTSQHQNNHHNRARSPRNGLGGGGGGNEDESISVRTAASPSSGIPAAAGGGGGDVNSNTNLQKGGDLDKQLAAFSPNYLLSAATENDIIVGYDDGCGGNFAPAMVKSTMPIVINVQKKVRHPFGSLIMSQNGLFGQGGGRLGGGGFDHLISQYDSDANNNNMNNPFGRNSSHNIIGPDGMLLIDPLAQTSRRKGRAEYERLKRRRAFKNAILENIKNETNDVDDRVEVCKFVPEEKRHRAPLAGGGSMYYGVGGSSDKDIVNPLTKKARKRNEKDSNNNNSSNNKRPKSILPNNHFEQCYLILNGATTIEDVAEHRFNYGKDIQQAIAKSADLKINKEVQRTFNLWLMLAGFLGFVALGFSFLGLLDDQQTTVEGPIVPSLGLEGSSGTEGDSSSSSSSITTELVGYATWENFTASCCCVPYIFPIHNSLLDGEGDSDVEMMRLSALGFVTSASVLASTSSSSSSASPPVETYNLQFANSRLDRPSGSDGAKKHYTNRIAKMEKWVCGNGRVKERVRAIREGDYPYHSNLDSFDTTLEDSLRRKEEMTNPTTADPSAPTTVAPSAYPSSYELLDGTKTIRGLCAVEFLDNSCQITSDYTGKLTIQCTSLTDRLQGLW